MKPTYGVQCPNLEAVLKLSDVSLLITLTTTGSETGGLHQ
jgi:hypothetical protein